MVQQLSVCGMCMAGPLPSFPLQLFPLEIQVMGIRCYPHLVLWSQLV